MNWTRGFFSTDEHQGHRKQEYGGSGRPSMACWKKYPRIQWCVKSIRRRRAGTDWSKGAWLPFKAPGIYAAARSSAVFLSISDKHGPRG